MTVFQIQFFFSFPVEDVSLELIFLGSFSSSYCCASKKFLIEHFRYSSSFLNTLQSEPTFKNIVNITTHKEFLFFERILALAW